VREEPVHGNCVRCKSNPAEVRFCGQCWCVECRFGFWMDNPVRMLAVLEFLSSRGESNLVPSGRTMPWIDPEQRQALLEEIERHGRRG
jgi:hypothetical protein